VRAVIHADSTSPLDRCLLPLRLAALIRLSADSQLPGASPHQAARLAGREAGHVASGFGHDDLGGALPDPRIVCIRTVRAANGAAARQPAGSGVAIWRPSRS
jgi:hypothetical protein